MVTTTSNKKKTSRGKRLKAKGYSLERYCVLTLEYNRYHVKRNAMSYGIEDVIAATKDEETLFIQVKNQQIGEKAMTALDKEILKRHAKLYGALPIYLYSEKKEKFWIDLSTNERLIFDKYTNEWYQERQSIKKKLSELKKKSRLEFNKYVLGNWDNVKWFIC